VERSEKFTRILLEYKMALVGATSLGQYLVKKGVISEGQLLNALKLQNLKESRLALLLSN